MDLANAKFKHWLPYDVSRGNAENKVITRYIVKDAIKKWSARL